MRLSMLLLWGLVVLPAWRFGRFVYRVVFGRRGPVARLGLGTVVLVLVGPIAARAHPLGVLAALAGVAIILHAGRSLVGHPKRTDMSHRDRFEPTAPCSEPMTDLDEAEVLMDRLRAYVELLDADDPGGNYGAQAAIAREIERTAGALGASLHNVFDERRQLSDPHRP